MTEERKQEIEATRAKASLLNREDYEAGKGSDPWRQAYYDDTTQLLLALYEAYREPERLRQTEFELTERCAQLEEELRYCDRLRTLFQKEETNLKAIWWGKPILAWAAWKIEQLAPELAPACDPFSEREIAAALAALVK